MNTQKMAIARAFTTIGRRRTKSEDDGPMPLNFARIGSQRAPSRPILRELISSPITLVSTSNTQVYEAQSIAGTTPIEIQHVGAPDSPKESVVDEDSDASAVFSDVDSSAIITDASSVDESPLHDSPGLEPNHLSCYFKPAVDTAATVRSRTSTTDLSARTSFDDLAITPRLPQRVPSHSKQAHERLHRKRSLQRMISPPPSARRAFHDTFGAMPESLDLVSESITSPPFVEAARETGPFSKELAQLDEAAEEFGQVVSTQQVERDPEAAYLAERGLVCFAAADYMLEIQALVYETFGVRPAVETPAPSWI